MELPVISYVDMAAAATGWLAVAVVGVFGSVASLFAAIAALRVFSRFTYFR